MRPLGCARYGIGALMRSEEARNILLMAAVFLPCEDGARRHPSLLNLQNHKKQFCCFCKATPVLWIHFLQQPKLRQPCNGALLWPGKSGGAILNMSKQREHVLFFTAGRPQSSWWMIPPRMPCGSPSSQLPSFFSYFYSLCAFFPSLLQKA